MELYPVILINTVVVIGLIVVGYLTKPRATKTRYVVFTRLGMVAFKAKKFRSIWAAKRAVWKRVPIGIQTSVGYVIVPVVPHRTVKGEWQLLRALTIYVPPITSTKLTRYRRKGK